MFSICLNPLNLCLLVVFSLFHNAVQILHSKEFDRQSKMDNLSRRQVPQFTARTIKKKRIERQLFSFTRTHK